MSTPSQTPTSTKAEAMTVLRAALMDTCPAETNGSPSPIQPLPPSEMDDALSNMRTKLAALFGSVLLMDPAVSSSVSHLQQLAAGIDRDLTECLDDLSSVTEAFGMILSVLHASAGSGVSPQALIRLIQPLHQQLESIDTDLVRLL